MRKIRIFIEEKNLNEGLEIKISGNDFEYLTKVMLFSGNFNATIYNRKRQKVMLND